MTTERAAAELRAWVAEEARLAREFDASEHRREAFPQTATGRALAAAPLARSARGPLAPGPLIVQREPTDGVTKGSGWQATLTANTTIPDGGGDVTFDTEESSAGVTVGLPLSELVIPQDCVASVQHLWVHWTDVDNDAAWKAHGSWVEIRINGLRVRPRLAAGTSGLSYSRLGPLAMPKMNLSQGDVFTVHVFQDSGSAQPAVVRLSVGMEDPKFTPATIQAWTKIGTADAWGVVKVGTSWWVTGGNDNDIVREYNEAFVLQSSFDANYSGNRVRGITFDGTDLWVAGDDSVTNDTVKRLNTSGVLQSSFGSGFEGVQGVAWDGTHLWVSGVSAGVGSVKRFTTGGTLDTSFTLSGAVGLAWHDGNLVVAVGDAVEVRTTAGTLVQTIGASEVGGPTGVWVAGDGTLYASKDGDGVWRWDGGTL